MVWRMLLLVASEDLSRAVGSYYVLVYFEIDQYFPTKIIYN